MKKFQFSLAGVQRYKEQTLDMIKMEYAAAENAVALQEKHVRQLQATFRNFNDALKKKNREIGININELNNAKRYLIDLQNIIDSEIIKQAKLEDDAEEVKQRMIVAKQEAASIDILREKQEAEYKIAVQKSEDSFIEEFISAKKYRDG